MNDPDLPDLGDQRLSLGQRRMEEFIQHNSQLQFMSWSLSLSLASAPGADYSDEAIECIKIDAEDLRATAGRYADWAIALADDWRAQREAQ